MEERPDPSQRCPACQRVLVSGKWVCQCGNILKLDVLRHQKPADRLPGVGEVPGSPAGNLTPTGKLGQHEQVTLKFDPVHGLSELFMGRVMPVSRPDVDIFALDLSPLELYLYSKVDGRRSAAELATAVGLKQVELGVLLLTLLRTEAITTTAKVSVSTVTGEGSSWTADVTTKMRAATIKGAEKQFEMFVKRRDTGDVDGAALHLKKAVAAEPAAQYVEALEEYLEKVVRKCDEIYAAARGALTQGNPAAAIEILERGIRTFGGEAGFHNLLAIATMALDKNTAKAISHLKRACHLDPLNVTYAANLKKLEGPGPRSGRSPEAPPPTVSRGFWASLRRLFGARG